MKRKLLIISAIVFSMNLFAQTSVNKTTIEIPKDFKQGKIVSANLNESNQLEIVLAIQKKKEVKLLQYSFDNDAKKVEEKEVSYETYKTKKKEVVFDGTEKLARFIRVGMSSQFLGSMTFEKGYIQKNFVNGRFIGQSFETENTYKVKTDDDRIIIPINYINVSSTPLTTKDFGLSPQGYYANGDLIAVGSVEGKLVTKGRMGQSRMDYCIVKASAKNFDVEKKTLIPFKYVQRTEICNEIVDNHILLITTDDQFVYRSFEEFYNKGSVTRTVTLINKNGDIESQYTFDGLPEMEIINASVVDNGNLYIIAKAGKKKEMAIVAIKIVNQKVAYMQKTLLSEMENMVVKPADEKKFNLFSEVFPYLSGKVKRFKGIFELNNQNMIVVYEEPGKTGHVYYLQFDETGVLKKHYTHATKEDLTAFDGNANRSIQLSIKQTDGNIFYPIVKEIKKEGTYYSICKIDGGAGTMSNFTTYGTKTNEDKNEYYLDAEFPFITTPDNGLILIGRTEDKDILWVNKIKFE